MIPVAYTWYTCKNHNIIQYILGILILPNWPLDQEFVLHIRLDEHYHIIKCDKRLYGLLKFRYYNHKN